MATAESLTGGQVASRLTAVPGASRCFLGGVVAYATQVKQQVLGVPESVVRQHGVVSEPCAVAMAEGVRDLMGATFGLSTTGVAGPDRQEGKPPGTVWIAVAGPARTRTRVLDLPGSRAQVQQGAVEAVVALLDDVVRSEEPGLR